MGSITSFRSKKIVAALEDLEENTGVVAPTETVPATTPEVEAAAQDMTEEVAEVEHLEAAVEDAEQDVAALTDVQDIMEESVEKGEGLDQQAAELAEVAVERICARLGFDKKQSTIPAMENFGSKASRLSATKVALEGVTDKIKRTIQAIINFIKMVWEKIKGFFAGLVRSRDALSKHLDALIKRAEGVDKAAKPKEASLKIGAAKALSVDGKADLGTARTVLKDSSALVTAAGTVAAVIASTVGKIESLQEDSIKGLAGDIEKGLKAKLPEAKVEGGVEGAAYYGHLAGAKSIGFKEGDKTFEIVLGQGKQAEEIPALSAAEALELLKEAKVTLKDLVKYEAVEKELTAASASAVKHLEKLANAADKMSDKDSEDNKKRAAAVAVARDLTKATSKAGQVFPALVFQAVKAAGDYASSSLNNLKAEKAE